MVKESRLFFSEKNFYYVIFGFFGRMFFEWMYREVLGRSVLKWVL